MPLITDQNNSPSITKTSIELQSVFDGFQVFRKPETDCTVYNVVEKPLLEMWANAQRDGCPDEYRWRPLFNAAGSLAVQ